MFRLYVNPSHGTVFKVHVYKEEHIDTVYEVIFISAMPLIIIINVSLYCTSWYLYLIVALNEAETCSSYCLKAAVIDGQFILLTLLTLLRHNRMSYLSEFSFLW